MPHTAPDEKARIIEVEQAESDAFNKMIITIIQSYSVMFQIS